MRHIEINSKSWHLLREEIVVKYPPGKLIPHKWLKNKFRLKELRFADYENEEGFIKALQEHYFDYMFLVEELRRQLLVARSGYMRNVRAEGHMILPAEEQVQYGYDFFMKTVKKGIRKTDPIMKHVPPVSAEQGARNSDIQASYATVKQMLAGIKKDPAD